MKYSEMTRPQLEAEYAVQKAAWQAICDQHLTLDMSRGKPEKGQLDLATDLLTILKTPEDCKNRDGFDTRNYGLPTGIPELKEIFAEILGVANDEIFTGGNSSLNMMYNIIVDAMALGFPESGKAWSKYDKIKFLCPAPGYDRHFSICQHLGIEMITIPMLPTGPDMDLVEKYAGEDETVKGIWCVPKYSNPTGVTFSDETVRRFCTMKTAAPDFKIFWDNAYIIHDLYDEHDEVLNIIEEAKKYGTEDRVFEFCSTSKVTIAGGGVSFVASSKANIERLAKRLSMEGLGYDKVNQLRHYRFFKDADGVREIMKRHAAILRPKFRAVIEEFEKGMGETGIANWHDPKGGYFISLNVMEGTAKRTWQLAHDAGVTLTNVGATFPYGKDPKDENLRIAPSNVKLADVGNIAKYVCVCARLAALEKLLNK